MLFDILYLMNYQPRVEKEVKCNEAQTEVPVQSVRVLMVYCRFIERVYMFSLLRVVPKHLHVRFHIPTDQVEIKQQSLTNIKVARNAFCSAIGASCAVPGCNLLQSTLTTFTRKTVRMEKFKEIIGLARIENCHKKIDVV